MKALSTCSNLISHTLQIIKPAASRLPIFCVIISLIRRNSINRVFCIRETDSARTDHWSQFPIFQEAGTLTGAKAQRTGTPVLQSNNPISPMHSLYPPNISCIPRHVFKSLVSCFFFFLMTGAYIWWGKKCELSSNCKTVKSLHVIQFYLLKTFFSFKWKKKNQQMSDKSEPWTGNQWTDPRWPQLIHQRVNHLFYDGIPWYLKHSFRMSTVIQGAISISYFFHLLWPLEYTCQWVNLT